MVRRGAKPYQERRQKRPEICALAKSGTEVMTIDTTTGAITIGDRLISPALTRRDMPEKATLVSNNEDYSTYTTNALDSEGELWNISLYFHKERITNVSLGISEPDYQTWDDWSETHELALLERYKVYLMQIPGNRGRLAEGDYEYKWGTVSALFDRKAGYSYIWIRYRGEQFRHKLMSRLRRIWTDTDQ